MKIIPFIFSFFCFSFLVKGQTNLGDAVKEHLTQLKQDLHLEESANFLLIFDYQNSAFDLDKNVNIISPEITSFELSSNDNFLIKFIISGENNKLVLNIINYRIKKWKEDGFELINLMNGATYEISH